MSYSKLGKNKDAVIGGGPFWGPPFEVPWHIENYLCHRKLERRDRSACDH